MRWAVVAPSGSAWESDLVAVLRDLLEHDVIAATSAADLRNVDCVVLTGDESWCDAIVAQAVAAETLGRALVEHAERDRLLLAIGAGFGAACALGLLPGRLVPNEPGGFLARMLSLRVEVVANPWAERAVMGDVWQMPMRSAVARFVAEDRVLDQLERDGLVLLRLLRNPVGSARDIAGVMSPTRNVLGLSVHPENTVDASLVEAEWPGLDSGRVLFESIADWVEGGVRRGSFESQR